MAANQALDGLKHLPGDVALSASAALYLNDSGRAAEADALLTEAEKVHPTAPELANQRGRLALQRKQFPEAREFFESALKLRPDWWEPYFHLSFIFEHDDNVSAAIEAAEQAVRLAPDELNARHRLIFLLTRDARPDASLRATEELTRDFPHDAEGWRHLIRLLGRLGRPADAERAAERATRYVPPAMLKEQVVR
jgi:tetratricopeptide (TPR) repeat protein